MSTCVCLRVSEKREDLTVTTRRWFNVCIESNKHFFSKTRCKPLVIKVETLPLMFLHYNHETIAGYYRQNCIILLAS